MVYIRSCVGADWNKKGQCVSGWVDGCVPYGRRRNTGLGRVDMDFLTFLVSLVSLGVGNPSDFSLKCCSHFFFNSYLIFFGFGDVCMKLQL